jgi:hypothetical protein
MKKNKTYHQDVGLIKTMNNFKIIYKKFSNCDEEVRIHRCYNYICALTFYYDKINTRYKESELIDIIPE